LGEKLKANGPKRTPKATSEEGKGLTYAILKANPAVWKKTREKGGDKRGSNNGGFRPKKRKSGVKPAYQACSKAKGGGRRVVGTETNNPKHPGKSFIGCCLKLGVRPGGT